ncbi:hypothetical protein E2562_026380 [Oryza meyeriana var. granulata]|uniref:Uncharacterized protein n=1 Tax=Oryza meyeriana var. granulata TaxID=110450 RepID=A0A6G1DMZ5_9ORYZ|nr:hypothetical protein E2562_026380 [Oryza meyeriana var. granulata]
MPVLRKPLWQTLVCEPGRPVGCRSSHSTVVVVTGGVDGMGSASGRPSVGARPCVVPVPQEPLRSVADLAQWPPVKRRPKERYWSSWGSVSPAAAARSAVAERAPASMVDYGQWCNGDGDVGGDGGAHFLHEA